MMKTICKGDVWYGRKEAHSDGRCGEEMHREPGGGQTVGGVIRARREELGLTLRRVAQLAECATSYLSSIENERRGRPPSDALLLRLEQVLRLPSGRLIEMARWQTTPATIRQEVRQLHSDQRAAYRLAELLAGGSIGEDGRVRGRLDEAYRSGELKRLVERLTGAAEASPVRVALPIEVPLINKVAAGYPVGFTDLGYPARVADEYVRCPDLSDPDAFAARVVGDSMLPAYAEGDIVIFSPARKVASGMDCFVRLEPNHESTFKRVYFETGAQGEALIRLQPLNAAYPPQVVSREQVAGLYAAVSLMRPVG